MTIPERVAAKLDELPDKPGCYLFRDRRGRIVYVGKAVSLRKRVRSYFRPSAWRRAPPKLRSLIGSVSDLDTLVARNEAEAILTEGRLIKEYRPRYNVSFRDDKQFLHLRLQPTDPFPRFELCRVRRNDTARYFGPYASAAAARVTLDFVEKQFGIRHCAPARPDAATHRHCHNDIVRHCLAPCLGSVSTETYRDRVEEACAFLEGRRPAVLDEVRERMRNAAAALDFETAAALRDADRHLRNVVRQRARQLAEPSPRPDEALVGIREIAEALGLKQPPRIMEAYDISNISGSHAVAAMVCFVDGRPRPQRYRRFRIRTVVGSDDPAMMAETLRRRFGKSGPSAVPDPDLVLVDGGIAQLRAALRELRALDRAHIPVAGLAKRQEELHVPGKRTPLRLPLDSPALKTLMRLRDEAHRFAIGYHRLVRNRALAVSALDRIPGVGPARKRTILQRFGSVQRLRNAGESDLAATPGIGQALARAILADLRPPEPKPEDGKADDARNASES